MNSVAGTNIGQSRPGLSFLGYTKDLLLDAHDRDRIDADDPQRRAHAACDGHGEHQAHGNGALP